jgi:hypothetical protein
VSTEDQARFFFEKVSARVRTFGVDLALCLALELLLPLG